MRFAEVIGDPIGHSLSPAIHRHWLETLGLTADYRATRVAPDGLGDWLAERRDDPDWLGANLTLPHKERILPLIDEIEPAAGVIGAANIVVRRGDRLVGANSDVEGIAAALDPVPLAGASIALIGAGGAARALLAYAARRGAAGVAIVARDPSRASVLASVTPGVGIEVYPVEAPEPAFESCAAIVNATPLGMRGADPMPPALLAAVARQARGKTLFDMVYQPLCTPFLKAGEAAGAEARDGLTMLIGQARRAFHLFFGVEPPADERDLRQRLAGATDPAA